MNVQRNKQLFSNEFMRSMKLLQDKLNAGYLPVPKHTIFSSSASSLSHRDTVVSTLFYKILIRPNIPDKGAEFAEFAKAFADIDYTSVVGICVAARKAFDTFLDNMVVTAGCPEECICNQH